MNLGLKHCDDGNLIDGDGCSSTCFIEPGFTCYNINGTEISNCTGYNRPNGFIIADRVDEERFDIYFTEDMLFDPNFNDWNN